MNPEENPKNSKGSSSSNSGFASPDPRLSLIVTNSEKESSIPTPSKPIEAISTEGGREIIQGQPSSLTKEMNYLILKYLQPYLDAMISGQESHPLSKALEAALELPGRTRYTGRTAACSISELDKKYGNATIGMMLPRIIDNWILLQSETHKDILVTEGLQKACIHSLIEPSSLMTRFLKDLTIDTAPTAAVDDPMMIMPSRLRPLSIEDIKSRRETGRSLTQQSLFPPSLHTHLYAQFDEMFHLIGHTQAIYCLAFDRFQRVFITGADDGMIKIWCCRSCRLITTLFGHQNCISDFSVSPDNQYLASGSLDGTIKVWRLSGPDKYTLVTTVVNYNHGVLTVEWHPLFGADQLGLFWLLSSDSEGICRVWDMSTILGPLSLDATGIPTRQRLRHHISQRPAGIIQPKCISFDCKSVKKDMIKCIAFSLSGGKLSVGGSDGLLRVFECPSVGASEFGVLKNIERFVVSAGLLSTERDGRALIPPGTSEREDMIIPQEEGTLLNGSVPRRAYPPSLPPQPDHPRVRPAAVTERPPPPPHNEPLYHYSKNEKLLIESNTSRYLLSVFDDHNGHLSTLAGSSDCQILSGGWDGTARIRKWDKKTHWWRTVVLSMTAARIPKTATATGHVKVLMVYWSLNDKYIVTASTDHTIRVWSPTDGELLHEIIGHTGEIYILVGHPLHDHLLLSGGFDGRVNIWDLATGEGVWKREVEGRRWLEGQWSPNGDLIIVTDDLGAIWVYGLGVDKECVRNTPREQFFSSEITDTSVAQGWNIWSTDNLDDRRVDLAGIPITCLYPSTYGREKTDSIEPLDYTTTLQYMNEVEELVHFLKAEKFLIKEERKAPGRAEAIEKARSHGRKRRTGKSGRASDLPGTEVFYGTDDERVANPPNISSNMRANLDDGQGQSHLTHAEMAELERWLNYEDSSDDLYVDTDEEEEEEGDVDDDDDDDAVVVVEQGEEQTDDEAEDGYRMRLRRRSRRSTRTMSTRRQQMEAASTPRIIHTRAWERLHGQSSEPESEVPTRSRRPTNRNTRGEREAKRGRSLQRKRRRVNVVFDDEDFDTSPSDNEVSMSGTEEEEDEPLNVVDDEALSSDKEEDQDHILFSSEVEQEEDGQQKFINKRTKGQEKPPNDWKKYLPPNWAYITEKTRVPYVPQIGDRVVYFSSGHMQFLRDLLDLEPLNKENKTKGVNTNLFWEDLLWNFYLLELEKNTKKEREDDWKHREKELENIHSYIGNTIPFVIRGAVLGIEYKVGPPLWLELSVLLADLDSSTTTMATVSPLLDHETAKLATIRYYQTDENFVILEEHYQHCLNAFLHHAPSIGQRVEIINENDNKHYSGVIKSLNMESEASSWDPWHSIKLSSGLLCNFWNLRQYSYQVSTGLSNSQNRCLISKLNEISSKDFTIPFIEPIPLAKYKTYCMINPLPVTLTLITSRLNNEFYRSLDAIDHEMRLMITNAKRFNEISSYVVRCAERLEKWWEMVMKDVRLGWSGRLREKRERTRAREYSPEPRTITTFKRRREEVNELIPNVENVKKRTREERIERRHNLRLNGQLGKEFEPYHPSPGIIKWKPALINKFSKPGEYNRYDKEKDFRNEQEEDEDEDHIGSSKQNADSRIKLQFSDDGISPNDNITKGTLNQDDKFNKFEDYHHHHHSLIQHEHQFEKRKSMRGIAASLGLFSDKEKKETLRGLPPPLSQAPSSSVYNNSQSDGLRLRERNPRGRINYKAEKYIFSDDIHRSKRPKKKKNGIIHGQREAIRYDSTNPLRKSERRLVTSFKRYHEDELSSEENKSHDYFYKKISEEEDNSMMTNTEEDSDFDDDSNASDMSGSDSFQQINKKRPVNQASRNNVSGHHLRYNLRKR